MTPEEFKSLPKGTFIVMRTGFYPIQVKLKLFFKWGIESPEKVYEVKEKGNRKVSYAGQSMPECSIAKAYPEAEHKRYNISRESTEQEFDECKNREEEYKLSLKNGEHLEREEDEKIKTGPQKPHGVSKCAADSHLSSKDEILINSTGGMTENA